MAAGDSSDITARLQSLLPSGWFARGALVKSAILGGLADALSGVFALLAAVKAQTRIATASGWFLDLIAFDFLGPWFLRRSGELDAPWRTRFIGEIFRERVTRAGLIKAVQQLTGTPPKLLELFNPGDCGGWDTGAFAWADNGVVAPALSGWGNPLGGWDAAGDFAMVSPGQTIAPSGGAGCWGDLTPFQVFLTVYRPAGQGTPIVAGWDTFAGAFDVGAIEWTSSDPTGLITDAEIYAAIARTAAAGVTCWVAIVNAVDNSFVQPTAAGALDLSNPIDSALLWLL